MKRKKILLLPLIMLCTSAPAQSLLEDPFLYLFLGKRANEFGYSGNQLYTNYGYARTIFQDPFAGFQLNDQFMPVQSMLNRKGTLYRNAGGGSNKVYTMWGLDGSGVNGLLLNRSFGQSEGAKQNVYFTGVHRYKSVMGGAQPAQPGRNDLNVTGGYRLYASKTDAYFEVKLTRVSEHTALQKPAYADSIYRLGNRYAMTQATLITRLPLGEKTKKGFHRDLYAQAEGTWIDQRAVFSVHDFDSKQQLLTGQVYYRTYTSDPSATVLTVGAELRAATIRETFDGQSVIPLTGLLSFYTEAERQFSPRTKLELSYRSIQLTQTGRWLHEPGARFTFVTGTRSGLYAYSQFMHRYVNVIPEYLFYLASDKTIVYNRQLKPDAFWRSGLFFEMQFSYNIRFSVAYHYDYYTSRNVADVVSAASQTVFRVLEHASGEHVAEARFSWAGRLLQTRFMGMYTNASMRLNGQTRPVAYISPYAALATVSLHERGKHYHPDLSVSLFYSARYLSGARLNGEESYTRAGFALNAHVSLPLAFFSHSVFYWKMPAFLKRMVLVTGCENLAGHRQQPLYGLPGNDTPVSSVNAFGQYYGRRWLMGLSIQLNRVY